MILPLVTLIFFRGLVEYIGELHFLAVGGRVETVKGIESDSLTIIYRDCIYCAGNELSPDPICANIPALYKQLLLEVLPHAVVDNSKGLWLRVDNHSL